MMVVDVPAALRFRFCLWFSSGNTSHILSSDDSLCVSPFRLTPGLSTFCFFRCAVCGAYMCVTHSLYDCFNLYPLARFLAICYFLDVIVVLLVRC